MQYVFGLAVLMLLAWLGDYLLRRHTPLGQETPETPTMRVALNQAKICLDCDVIFAAKNDTCPQCGYTFCWPLVAWIETKTTSKIDNGGNDRA